MSSISESYEDTLNSMRTGKKGTPMTNIKNLMTWGGTSSSTQSLPTSKTKTENNASFLSWPPWTGNNKPTPFYDTFGMSMMQRYTAFGICIVAAALLFFVSFVHMPLLILRPSKFVTPYCLGNVFIFISFGFLHGFYSYLKHLFSRDRIVFSASFIGSTFLTLYVAMILRVYLLIIPMTVIQFFAMCTYIISYLPGGSSSISMLSSYASAAVRSAF